jgi:3-dehydroquinate dehydratase type I
MICLTGNENTIEILGKRLADTSTDFLQEVRLDYLDQIDDSLWALLEKHKTNIVACCRPPDQGGNFKGTEQYRLSLLEKLSQTDVAYLDIENNLDLSICKELKNNFSGKLIVSWHCFERQPAETEIENQVQKMTERMADINKIAVTVDDAIELENLQKISLAQSRPTIAIGMGPAGLLSRVRYPSFGSPWSYVITSESGATAPGQLTLQQARCMGLPDSSREPFVVLIGGEQIIHSPGNRVYNSLFRAKNLPWSYFPVITTKAGATIKFLQKLGALGAGVTMPHKLDAFEASQADLLAESVQAANSLTFRADQVLSSNTDIEGIKIPLAQAIANLRSKPKKAIILGAGGAAKAACEACKQLDLSIIVVARNIERARSNIGPKIEIITFERRAKVPGQILINTTPLAGKNKSPWPKDKPLNKDIVFDLALTDEPSSLLEQANTEGAITISAIDMWLVQGAKQMSWITQKDFSVEDLRRHL